MSRMKMTNNGYKTSLISCSGSGHTSGEFLCGSPSGANPLRQFAGTTGVPPACGDAPACVELLCELPTRLTESMMAQTFLKTGKQAGRRRSQRGALRLFLPRVRPLPFCNNPPLFQRLAWTNSLNSGGSTPAILSNSPSPRNCRSTANTCCVSA